MSVLLWLWVKHMFIQGRLLSKEMQIQQRRMQTDIHHIALVSWYSSVWKMKFGICFLLFFGKHNFKASNRETQSKFLNLNSFSNELHPITRKHLFGNIGLEFVNKTTSSMCLERKNLVNCSTKMWNYPIKMSLNNLMFTIRWHKP